MTKSERAEGGNTTKYRAGQLVRNGGGRMAKNKENEKQTRGDEVYDEQEFYDSPGCSRRFRRIKILCL